ncbi:MFS transporter [Agromyces aerolatus]|uniref:MFS transporter n=1 Tax=Agromyces sp. LY-1074 TaxID=3074080 RepID=UPI00285B77FB|nr:MULTISPECIES: MFS transporter [unclassified Agromyces]MDR5700440.1 MFS transporter [Agromyces sp. LY-1074]MDR5706961.1 MFS transporter [Agromyces sp. LY-1358]
MFKHRPRAQLHIHLVLAGAYFALYALLLTVVPSWATRQGADAAAASLLVSLLAVSALITDTATGRLVGRLGPRPVMFAGAATMAVGAAVLFADTGYAGSCVAAVVLGCAFSLLFTPILSGLASHAGPNQVWAQTVNSAWQRGGALIAALFLVNVASPSSSLPVFVATVVLVAGLVVTIAIARAPSLDDETVRAAEAEALAATAIVTADGPAAPGGRQPRSRLAHLIRESPKLRLGLIVSAATPLLVIAGSSFFPLYLLATDRAHLVAPALVAREIVAIVFVLLLARVVDRRRLARLWLVALAIGALGFAATALPVDDVVLVVVFALHGAAISSGIVTGNVLIFDGTSARTRPYGYAAGSMVSRLASLVLPLVMGLALTVDPGAMSVTVGGLSILVAIIFAATYRKAINVD